jgi:hypothetical protein
MPERCDSSCSTVTASSINGRSAPRTARAVVPSSSTPSSMSATTASAVNAFEPLASAKRVSTVLGIPHPRWAMP